ncbi:MAG: ferritin family protein [Dehalococcoidia bacterium]|nr:ferritin family protein [Dehalococcoidia bacterium]
MEEHDALLKAWRAAIKEEASAERRYRRAVELASDPAAKALFEYLAGEETKHKNLLDDEYQKRFAPDN